MLSTLHNILIIAFTAVLSVLLSNTQSIAQESYTAEIEIVTPGGEVNHSQTLAVGDTLELQGLPFPLQNLNGGEFHLPEDALAENIELEITLPDFAEVANADQQVSFGEQIANAVEMKVSVDGEQVSPYKFEKPVELSLPIPDQLPTGIGEDVSNFILTYVDEEGDFVTEGIATTVSDTTKSIVSAEIEHFSSIAMTEDSEATHSGKEDEVIPQKVELNQNYPNPFNPTTTIEFSIPEQSEVRVTIYNSLGERVATLIESTFSAGTHNVMWDASNFASGVYFYRLEVGDHIQTKQMSLIK